MVDERDDIPADLWERVAALPEASRDSVTPAEWESLTAQLRAQAQAEGTLGACESVLRETTLRDQLGGVWWYDGGRWQQWQGSGWMEATPPLTLRAQASRLAELPPVPDSLDELFPRCRACNNPGAPEQRFCLLCGTDRALPPGSPWRCLLCASENAGPASTCARCGWTLPAARRGQLEMSAGAVPPKPGSSPEAARLESAGHSGICVRCGAPMLGGARFCLSCGTPAP